MPRIQEQLLKELVEQYYTAIQMGHIENPSPSQAENLEELLTSLQERAAKILRLQPGERVTCACGVAIVSLIDFFGPDYMEEGHIDDCGICEKHTLHVCKDVQICLSCGTTSGIDADGNHIVDGRVVSNGGKDVEQLRADHFDGPSFMIG